MAGADGMRQFCAPPRAKSRRWLEGHQLPVIGPITQPHLEQGPLSTVRAALRAVPEEEIRRIVEAAREPGLNLIERRQTQQRRFAMKVKDAMHKGVDWVSPDIPVTELAKLMREHDIGAIPIGENDHLIGMVTDRDIVCKGLAQDGFDVRRATARDVMTPGIH